MPGISWKKKWTKIMLFNNFLQNCKIQWENGRPYFFCKIALSVRSEILKLMSCLFSSEVMLQSLFAKEEAFQKASNSAPISTLNKRHSPTSFLPCTHPFPSRSSCGCCCCCCCCTIRLSVIWLSLLPNCKYAQSHAAFCVKVQLTREATTEAAAAKVHTAECSYTLKMLILQLSV